jgi:hypothetical protein
MRYGVVLHSSSHVVDRCSVIQSLSVSVTACAGYTPVQAVTGCVPVSVLVAVFLFLWELTPGRHNGFRLFRSVVSVTEPALFSACSLLVSSSLSFSFTLSTVMSECRLSVKLHLLARDGPSLPRSGGEGQRAGWYDE